MHNGRTAVAANMSHVMNCVLTRCLNGKGFTAAEMINSRAPESQKSDCRYL